LFARIAKIESARLKMMKRESLYTKFWARVKFHVRGYDIIYIYIYIYILPRNLIFYRQLNALSRRELNVYAQYMRVADANPISFNGDHRSDTAQLFIPLCTGNSNHSMFFVRRTLIARYHIFF